MNQIVNFQLTDGMTISFINIKQFVTTPYDYRIIHDDGSIRLVNRTHVIAVELQGIQDTPAGSTLQ